MKRSKKLVIGNWKTYPQDLDEAKKIVAGVKRIINKLKRTSVVICPPFIYLAPFSNISKKSLYLGAQDASFEEVGAFTGEVSYSQLPQFKVRFVIVGHSERRREGEDNETVNKKMKAVTSSGMTAVLCVGESVRDSAGDYYHFIKEQIISALKDVPKKLLSNIVIAYEPIWAIGSTSAITPRDLHVMSIFIKKVLKDTYGDASSGIEVIYGGSVDKVNAATLIEEGNVSGLLVGRQSLTKDFLEIIKTVDSI